MLYFCLLLQSPSRATYLFVHFCSLHNPELQPVISSCPEMQSPCYLLMLYCSFRRICVTLQPALQSLADSITSHMLKCNLLGIVLVRIDVSSTYSRGYEIGMAL